MSLPITSDVIYNSLLSLSDAWGYVNRNCICKEFKLSRTELSRKIKYLINKKKIDKVFNNDIMFYKINNYGET